MIKLESVYILAGLMFCAFALFNLRDLITDFDEAFLDAMTHQRDDDGDADSDGDESEDDEEEESEESDDAE